MSTNAPVGAISKSISSELARSETYWTWLTQHLHNVSFAKSRRNVFTLAMFQVAADHQATLVLAVKAVRFASALALVRPLCEATMMGMWIQHVATDAVLEAMANSRFAPPSLDDLVKRLDKQAFFDRPMYRDIEAEIRRMHGFNHGGVLHIASRYKGNSVGANYSDQDVIWALRTADLFAVLAALETAQIIGDAERGQRMYDEAREWLERGTCARTPEE